MATTYATPEEIFEAKKKSAKPMMWIGIVGIVMFFSGLTSAYVIRQAQGDWLYFDVPSIFFGSTAVIIVSSITMLLAQRAGRRGNAQQVSTFLIATLMMGIAFTIMQFMGFYELYDRGITFTGEGSNISGSFFIILIFAHAAHVFAGLLALIFTTVKALLNKYSAENHVGIDVCGIYWHFLDVLWIYLILFLVFIR
ncbi:MAG: cytochrome c oxidase subunit 3 [Flavobacteriales bacterium]